MVGIVLVSHSRALALAVQELVRSMTGPKLPLVIAAGTGEGRTELGTDAMEILEGINSVMSDEGVLVLMDMGSALLSTETALGFLDESAVQKVRLCPAPFVEGAVAAGVLANLGSSLDEVAHEAEGALRQKSEHLGPVTAEPSPAPAESQESGQSIRVIVRNPHGLHARPAARLIREASQFSSAIEVRNLTAPRGPTTIKSLTGLAMLEVQEGHEIELTARGADAGVALSTLRQAIENGLGESIGPVAGKPAGVQAVDRVGVVAVSSGIAIGPLFWGGSAEIEWPAVSADNPEDEMQALHTAIAQAGADLTREETALKTSVGQDEAAILRAQMLVLEDPALLENAGTAIRQKRETAARAWYQAYEGAAQTYEKLTDEYLRQRAADVRDVGRRVLTHLGIEDSGLGELPEPGLLVVDDLAPSEVARLSSESVLGVICLRGGKTSHAAILLRARGIPAIARAQTDFDRVGVHRASTGIIAALDGDRGNLWLNPNPQTVQELRTRAEKQRTIASEETEHRHEVAQTRDGRAVTIWANLGQPADAAPAVDRGAEGVGLFRTEFLFLHREQAPTEEEQFVALREVQRVMEQRPVIIRTLDIGGDKEAPYLGLPREANPFLGVRAVRLGLAHPELFQPHLRAILRAAHGGNFRIMFPMIADPTELAQARAALEDAHRSLVAENQPHAWPLPIGIMIEVPSAVTLIDQLARVADFFSIGTNDLTQYILAADRGNPALAHFQDSLHPAVLRQIQQVVEAAAREGKEVGICGEAAADPQAAQIFIGLGVTELSLSAARIPKIKAAIRQSSHREAEALAVKALTLADAEAVRKLFAE